MEKEKRTEFVAVRVTPSMKKAVRMAAAHKNIDQGKYILQAIAWRIRQEDALMNLLEGE